MGVKLDGIMERRNISLNELKGTVIAIDGPNVVFAVLNFRRKNSTPDGTDLILDRTQRVISHLYGILYRVKFYYNKGILPVFCFDGRVSPLKRLTTKNQLNDFRYAEKRYRNAIKAGNTPLARKIALSREYLWPNVIQESKSLLSALGVPIIEAPSSAESQCAELVKQGTAHYSNSQDFDSLLFGCPMLLQNFSKSRRRKIRGRWRYQKVEPMVCDLSKNLGRMGINRFQLVDAALMLKTDYFDGIKGVGPKTALKFIRKYGSIETIIAHEKARFNFEELSPELIARFRKLYLLPDVIESFEDLRWDPPNKQKVLEQLSHSHFLNPKRVGDNSDKLIEYFDTTIQYFRNQSNNHASVQKTLDMMF